MSPLRHIVIPAAGLGSRMRKVSPKTPKELLPVAGRPAIQYAVDEAVSAGILSIIIILREDKNDIRRWFEDSDFAKRAYPDAGEQIEKNRACSFTFLYQESPRGECDALALAWDALGDAPFAVFYPDNIPARVGALKIVRRAFEKTGLDTVALTRVPDHDSPGVSDSGRVDLALNPEEKDLFYVRRFWPKGPGGFVKRFPAELRTCGIYAALPHYFDFIAKTDSARMPGELTDGKVRRLMLARGLSFAAAPLPDPVFDVGNPEGYARCLEALFLKK
ncbi:MAG: sugar phosphate nucleotidyltransferase [Thermodesulfobacteriota bacterium]|nr:sugar phosphate nucleotidyltransferase [Thermodesulfobacteriota bacterium]